MDSNQDKTPRCVTCNKDMFEVGVLSRVNPTGLAGIWACDQHREEARKKYGGEQFDEETDRIANIIAGDASSREMWNKLREL